MYCRSKKKYDYTAKLFWLFVSFGPSSWEPKIGNHMIDKVLGPQGQFDIQNCLLFFGLSL